MKFNMKNIAADKHIADCIIVGLFDTGELTRSAENIDRTSGGFINDIVSKGDIQGKLGQCLLLHHIPNIHADRVLLVGCGSKDKLNERNYIKMIQAAFKTIKGYRFRDVALYLTELLIPQRDTHWLTRTAIISIADNFYTFDQLKQKKADKSTLEEITLFGPSTQDMSLGEEALKEAIAISSGMNFAKDLGNLPSNICTPTYLAEKASELAKQHSHLKARIIEEKALKKMGANALLAVGQGSAEPSKLIVLEYDGGNRDKPPIALVGKGVTFDTGGICIKPSPAMDEMKFDMCGAASVLGIMKAVAELQLPLHIVGVVASVENMPGSEATNPGDIVTGLSGKSIEILNTDAEGRLILSDALTYTQQNYHPEIIIDMATLTGSVMMALGSIPSGLFSNNDDLSDEIQLAATQSFDRVWRLPVWDEYQEGLNSNFADLANISGNRLAGATVAACFLNRFIENETPWAHLDIAGTASKSGKQKGATGRPIPLMVQFLLNRAAKASS